MRSDSFEEEIGVIQHGGYEQKLKTLEYLEKFFSGKGYRKEKTNPYYSPFVDQGGLDLLTKIAIDESTDVVVKAKSYIILTYLARVNETKLKLIENDKFVESIITSSSSKDEKLVDASLGCLWNCTLHPSNENTLNHNVKLIDHLLSKITTTTDSESLTSLLGCFVGLTHNEIILENEPSLITKISEKYIPILVSMLSIDFVNKINMNNKENNQEKEERIREGVVAILWNISIFGSNKEVILGLNPHKDLVSLLLEKNTHTVNKTLGLLSVLMEGDQVAKFMEIGVLDHIKKIIFDKSDLYDEDILIGAYRCLWAINEISSFTEQVYENFLEKIMLDIKAHKNKSIISNAYGVLVHFTFHESTRHRLAKTSHWKIFVEYLSHPSPNIRKFTCTGIYNISFSAAMTELIEIDPIKGIINVLCENISIFSSCNLITLIMKMYCGENPQYKKLHRIRELGGLPVLIYYLGFVDDVISTRAQKLITYINTYDQQSTLIFTNFFGIVLKIRAVDDRILGKNYIFNTINSLKELGFEDLRTLFNCYSLCLNMNSKEDPSRDLLKSMYLYKKNNWNPSSHSLYPTIFRDQVFLLFMIRSRKKSLLNKIILHKICFHLSVEWSWSIIKNSVMSFDFKDLEN